MSMESIDLITMQSLKDLLESLGLNILSLKQSPSNPLALEIVVLLPPTR